MAFSQSMCWGLDDNSARLDCTTKGILRMYNIAMITVLLFPSEHLCTSIVCALIYNHFVQWRKHTGEVVWDHYTSPTDCTGKFLFKESIKEECELSVRLTAGIDADDDRGLFNPPPSISTTPFTPSGPGYAFNSNRWHCTPASKLVTLSVTQVSAALSVLMLTANICMFSTMLIGEDL